MTNKQLRETLDTIIYWQTIQQAAKNNQFTNPWTNNPELFAQATAQLNEAIENAKTAILRNGGAQ